MAASVHHVTPVPRNENPDLKPQCTAVPDHGNLRKLYIGYLLLIVLNFSSSSPMIFAQLALKKTSIFELSIIRFIIQALISYVMCLFRGKSLKITHYWYLTTINSVLDYGFSVFVYFGASYMPVGNVCGVFVACYVFLTVCFDLIRRRVTPVFALAGIPAVLGILLLVQPWHMHAHMVGCVPCDLMDGQDPHQCMLLNDTANEVQDLLTPPLDVVGQEKYLKASYNYSQIAESGVVESETKLNLRKVNSKSRFSQRNFTDTSVESVVIQNESKLAGNIDDKTNITVDPLTYSARLQNSSQNLPPPMVDHINGARQMMLKAPLMKLVNSSQDVNKLLIGYFLLIVAGFSSCGSSNVCSKLVSLNDPFQAQGNVLTMKGLQKRQGSGTEVGLNLFLDADIVSYVQSQMLCGVVCRLSLLTAIQDNDTKMSETVLKECGISCEVKDKQLLIQASLQGVNNAAMNTKASTVSQCDNMTCSTADSEPGKHTCFSADKECDYSLVNETGHLVSENKSGNMIKTSYDALKFKNSDLRNEENKTPITNRDSEKGNSDLLWQKMDTFDEALGNWCDEEEDTDLLNNNPQIPNINGIDIQDPESRLDADEHLWGKLDQKWDEENWESELTESVPCSYQLRVKSNESVYTAEVTEEFFSVETSSSVHNSVEYNQPEETESVPEREYELVTCNPRKLYVSNVAFRTSTRRLWAFFEENFGPVEYCQLLKDKWNHSKGRGFVTFKDLESAEKAKAAEYDKLVLDRRDLHVEQATWKKYKPRWEEMRKSRDSNSSEVTKDPINPSISSNLNVTESGVITDNSEVSRNEPENSDETALNTTSDLNKTPTRSFSVTNSECTESNCDNVKTSDFATENNNSEGGNSSDEKCNTVSVNCLSDYILLYIFSYLPLAQRVQCERVCKMWQAICARHWQSLKHLSFTGQVSRHTVFTDRVLKRVFKFGCPTLESLDLSSVSRTLGSAAIQIIGKNCPNVKKINLAGMTLNQKSLRSLSEMCRSIEWLSLRNCHEVGEKGLWSLFVNCKQLRYLNLADNRRINGKCFHVSGHHVVTLDLSDCVQLSDDGLRKLADRWKVLEELHLSGCLNITDSGFRPLCESLKSLRVLSLCGTIAGVTAVGLRNLSAMPLLEELDLNRNNSVDDSVVSAVAYHCTQLRTLDLTLCGEGVTDVSLCALAFSKHLEELAVSYLINIEESGLTQISANGKLHKFVARGCSAIPEQAFISLVTLCPFLTLLDVCGCGQVTMDLVSTCVSELLRRKDGQLDLHTDGCLDLYIGGTSVNREDLPPIPEGLLCVHHHNLCVDYLRPDRELFFGDMLFDDDEDFSDDFHDLMDPYDFEDDFLDHDDPLYAERFLLT